MNSKSLISLCILVGMVALLGFTIAYNQDPWPVPEKYEKMANPVKPDAESLATGKSLWVKHCQSCHGKKGLGDGTKAAQLKTPAGDFSKPEFKKQSDGAIFYKSLEGRDDMPNFKKKIPDQDDLWSVVNYIRTLKN
jgi:mono/diheme cytochrome c family protein